MVGGFRALRSLVWATVLAGSLAAAVILRRYGADGIGRTPNFLVLAGALVAAYVVPLPVPRGEQLEDVELEEPLLVAMLV
ncbi:MAG: hypothetical protein ABI912_01275, partial [Actinomycetota bacterium]